MIRDDSQSPATKEDIRLLMEMIGTMIQKTESWRAEIKEEMGQLRIEMRQEMEQWKEEIVRHFEVLLEEYRHDLLGVNKDEIVGLQQKSDDHENRIARLESIRA